MYQTTIAICRLLYCVYAMMYLVACAPQQPIPTDSRQSESARKLNPPPLPEGKYALAILPWSITGGFEDSISAELEGLRALNSILHETDFIPTHSYYEMETVQPKRLTRKEFPELRRTWRGKNLNMDAILRLGSDLGVRAVFLYDMDVNFGTDVLRAYIVDMASQKTYEAEGTTWDFAEESYEALLGLAREVLAAYTRDRA